MATIVGRDRELGRIEAFLDLADGASRVLLVEGEAGIGKTTLWRAAIDEAAGRGYRVLSCSAAGSEAQVSFAALRDLVGDAFDEVADELPSPQRRALAVTLLLEEPSGSAPEPGAIATALLTSLRLLARRSPTVIAVDDVQWLDLASAAPLAHVLRRLGQEPLVALLACRAEQGEARPLALDRMETAPVVVIASTLTIGALGRILHSRLGVTYPRPTLHRLHDVSAGNPFYALELARALNETGRPLTAGDPLPVRGTLLTLVGEHLSSLPVETLEALAFASALSRPSVALVSAAIDGDAMPSLEKATDGQVAYVDGDFIRFVHPLYAAATYDLDPSRLQALHSRLADVVTDPEERARHLSLSVNVPDGEVAAELESAARSSRARGSPSSSAELLEHAIRLSPVDDPARARRVIEAADAHFEAGDTDRALSLLQSLCQELPAGGERAATLYRLAVVHGELADAVGAAALYESVLAEPGLEPLIAAHVHSDLAWLAPHVSDVAYGIRSANRAVAVAEGLAAPTVRAEAFTALSFVQGVAGTISAPDLLDEALALEASGAHFRIDRSPSVVSGSRLMWSGELDAARERFAAVREIALERGDETNTSILGYYLALVEIHAGNYTRARELVEEAALLTEQTGVNRSPVHYATALLDAHVGDVEAAIATAEATLANAEIARDRVDMLRSLAVVGFARLSQGDLPRALESLSGALELARAIGIGQPALARFVPDAVEVLAALGKPGEAETVLEGFAQAAHRLGHTWAIASVNRCKGLIRAASRDVQGALDDLERARDDHEGTAFPFERARTLLALGSVQRRARQRALARETLTRSVAIFEGLGSPLWAAKARAELGRIGGRTAARSELTTAEERIAALVAEGKSNKEVAATLFISVKTVEVTLTRVYRKLGVKSRAELAARFTELAKQ